MKIFNQSLPYFRSKLPQTKQLFCFHSKIMKYLNQNLTDRLLQNAAKGDNHQVPPGRKWREEGDNLAGRGR
jgi:hypothetical protein